MKRPEISAEMIATLAASLTNAELGAALRLLSNLLVGGKPVAEKRLPVVCGMDPEAWKASADSILEHFVRLTNGAISHPLLEARSLPACAESRNVLGGTMHDMLTVEKTRRPPVPAFAKVARPDPISIRKAIFDNGIELFLRSGKNEVTARSLIAGLCKTYREGDIAEAIATASRDRELVDPYAWVVNYLKRTATPKMTRAMRPASSPAPRREAAHPLATPEFLGVSERTAEKIRARNRSLTLDLGLSRKG